jgi:long-subunit acyl-CoA synthetase (AMP-forming)
VVDGDRQFTYAEFRCRVDGLTAGLARRGLQAGDRVAALCASSHVMLELHHALPSHGTVLVPLNVRLSEVGLGYIIKHSGASLLIATHEFADRARAVATVAGIPVVAPAPPVRSEPDETGPLAINYTSGITGRPKGVLYHHRGAYLRSVAMPHHAELGPGSRYLWTLPMFHCDGWCSTWAVTAAGGTHVCLHTIDTGLFANHVVAVFRSVTTRRQAYSASASTPVGWTQPQPKRSQLEVTRLSRHGNLLNDRSRGARSSIGLDAIPDPDAPCARPLTAARKNLRSRSSRLIKPLRR